MRISLTQAAFNQLGAYLLLPLVVAVATCGVWWGLFSASWLLFEMLFYRGCAAALGCFVVMVVASLILSRLRVMGPRRTGASVGLAGLYIGLIMTFFVVFPVSYDRSLSVFLLARIAVSGDHGISSEQLERDLIEKSVIERHAVKRRLKEQLASGTIEQAEDARVTLSERGRGLLCLNPILEELFDYHNPELVGACSIE